MGFGSGSRNPRARALRLGLLAVVLVAAVLFHGHGRAYEGVRILYYLGIVGLLVARFAGRSRRQGPPGGGFGPRGRGRFGAMGGPPGYGPPGYGVPPSYGAPAEPHPGASPPGAVDPSGPGSAERWPAPDPAIPPVDPPLGPVRGGA